MRLQNIFPEERSEIGFGLSFAAAIASYSVFTSWLSVMPGFASFLGGFVSAYVCFGLLSYFEDRRRLESRRGERVEKLLKLVAESQIRDRDLLEIADLKR